MQKAVSSFEKTTEAIMKRFILSILAVTVFFLGVGSLIERTGARFKSDDKALALVAKARQAIGGDAAITSVQSMRIVGRTTRTFKVDGADKTSEGETEIAMQFPDKFMKMVKIGDGAGELGERQFDVAIAGEPRDHFKVQLDAPAGEPGVHKKIVIKKDDGTEQVLTDADADKWIAEHPGVPGDKQVVIRKMGENGEELPGGDKIMLRHGDDDGNVTFTTKDGKTIIGNDRVILDRGERGERGEGRNDLVRFGLSLLLTPPQGTDVEYASGGEATVKGRPCNVVVATTGGRAYKLFLDAVSNMPVALNYTGFNIPAIMKFTRPVTAPADGGKDVVTFKRVAPESTEFQVVFSDFRSVNGVQLPFHWEQTAGGEADETFDVTSYEINPANIAEKFQQQPKVMMRMKKPEIQ